MDRDKLPWWLGFLVTAGVWLMGSPWLLIAAGVIIGGGLIGAGAYQLGHKTGQEIPGAKPAAATIIQNPATEITYGPYQPEEIRQMILALGQLQDTLEKKYRPALVTVTTGSLYELWKRAPINEFTAKIEEVRREYQEALRATHMIVYSEYGRFKDELVPTIEDKRDVSSAVIRGLDRAIDTARVLAKIDAPRTGDTYGIIARDSHVDPIPINQWLHQSIENIKAKTAKLRAAYRP